MKAIRIGSFRWSGYKSIFAAALMVGIWMAMLGNTFAQSVFFLNVGTPCLISGCVPISVVCSGSDELVSDDYDVVTVGEQTLDFEGYYNGGEGTEWTGGVCGLSIGANELIAYSEELDTYSDPTTVTLAPTVLTCEELKFFDPQLSWRGTAFITDQPMDGGHQVADITGGQLTYSGGANCTITFSITCPAAGPTDWPVNNQTVTEPAASGTYHWGDQGTDPNDGFDPLPTADSPYWPPLPQHGIKFSGNSGYITITVIADGCNITGFSLTQPPHWGPTY